MCLLAGTLTGCAERHTLVVIADPSAYVVTILDDGAIGLISVDIDTATSGLTATVPDLGARPLAAWQVGASTGDVMLAVGCDDSRTRFIRVTDRGTTVTVLPQAADTGLAAWNGGVLAWMQPITARPAGEAQISVLNLATGAVEDASVDIIPDRLIPTPDGFLAVSSTANRTTLVSFDSSFAMQATAEFASGRVLALGWNDGPVAITADANGDRPVDAFAGQAVIRGVGTDAQAAALAGASVAFRSAATDSSTITVMRGTATRSVPDRETSSPLGLVVTEDGQWAALHTAAVVVGSADADTTTTIPLPGDVISQW